MTVVHEVHTKETYGAWSLKPVILAECKCGWYDFAYEDDNAQPERILSHIGSEGIVMESG